MKIQVIRKIKTDKSTIGELYIDNKFICYTLEDKDRNLKKNDPVNYIIKNKIYGLTAIPSGTYKVIINLSNRFNIIMPLLLDVPGYEGVRIHSGNTSADTLGCILLGLIKDKDFVGDSRKAFAKLMDLIKNSKDITIEII
jgi:hypothetical protein